MRMKGTQTWQEAFAQALEERVGLNSTFQQAITKQLGSDAVRPHWAAGLALSFEQVIVINFVDIHWSFQALGNQEIWGCRILLTESLKPFG